MTFTADYFIEKFTAISEEDWCVGLYTDQTGSHCALGHCGVRNEYGNTEGTTEGTALWQLFQDAKLSVSDVNDGWSRHFKQPTPKQRIIAALNQIKSP